MNFGKAIELIKQGGQASRKGWNGKNQHIELAKNITFVNRLGKTFVANHEDIGSQAIAFVGTRGIQMGWLASQSDMLAEDWIGFDIKGNYVE